MAIRINDLDKPYEIDDYAMPHHQPATACAFERAGYTVSGSCLAAITLRSRDTDGSWHPIKVGVDGASSEFR